MKHIRNVRDTYNVLVGFDKALEEVDKDQQFSFIMTMFAMEIVEVGLMAAKAECMGLLHQTLSYQILQELLEQRGSPAELTYNMDLLKIFHNHYLDLPESELFKDLSTLQERMKPVIDALDAA